MELTARDIRRAIRTLKRIKPLNERSFLIPANTRVISNRYSKIGRPKKSDYDYIENPVIKELVSAGWYVKPSANLKEELN